MDREKVIKDLEECLSASCRGFRPRLSCPYNDDEWDIMRDALDLLKEHETVAQKTGHWIWLQFCANEGVYCSECHTKMFDRYPMKKKLSQFCGHCGAKMVDEVERR